MSNESDHRHYSMEWCAPSPSRRTGSLQEPPNSSGFGMIQYVTKLPDLRFTMSEYANQK